MQKADVRFIWRWDRVLLLAVRVHREIKIVLVVATPCTGTSRWLLMWIDDDRGRKKIEQRSWIDDDGKEPMETAREGNL